MKTFLIVNLGLAPLIVFWLLLGCASPGAAVAVGLAGSIALGAWRLARREFFILEVGGLATFLVMGALALAAPAFFANAALWAWTLRMASRMSSMPLRSARSMFWLMATVVSQTCLLPFNSWKLSR